MDKMQQKTDDRHCKILRNDHTFQPLSWNVAYWKIQRQHPGYQRSDAYPKLSREEEVKIFCLCTGTVYWYLMRNKQKLDWWVHLGNQKDDSLAPVAGLPYIWGLKKAYIAITRINTDQAV